MLAMLASSAVLLSGAGNLEALMALQAKPETKIEITAPEITSISLFKNGFAFVTRKIKIKNGEANIIEVPRASLGTLWFWTPDGEIESVSTAEEVSIRKDEVALASFDQVVTKNIGKSVTLEVRNPNSTTTTYEGKIKSALGDIIVLETANGTTAIPKGGIHTLKSTDAGFLWTSTLESRTEQKFYKLKTTNKTSEVRMMSLERGASWAPGYAIDITDPKKLTMVSKATVMNDLADINNVGVRLITGFPNLQFMDILDPFTANMGTDQWLNSLNGPGGGGMGGGARPASRAREVMSQNAYAPMADADQITWGGSNASSAGGEQIGDLFFYDLPKFTIKKGARTYQNLFKFEAEYKHIYTWDVDDNVVNNTQYRPEIANQPDVQEVWHTIRYLNNSGKPLTTAAGTIINRGELIGQTMLNYCPASADVDVKINKALDVRPEATEEELSRERGAIQDQYKNPRWDLVTVKGTLEVLNGRREDVQMTITKQFTGEFVSGTESPVVIKTTKGLRQINPSGKMTWKHAVKPGEKFRMEYTYKLYVPSNQQ